MKPIINTRNGKREFIRALMASLKKQLLESVGKMPAEWDGHELRELIADITQGGRTNEMKTNRRRASPSDTNGFEMLASGQRTPCKRLTK